MTIEYLSSKRIQGVTADTKPTNVPTGTEFMNTQTRVLSIFNGTSWDDVTGGGGGATTLDGLTDVTITSPANNNVLTYNSTTSQWGAAVPPGASGGEANTLGSVGTGEGTLPGTKVGTTLNVKSLKQGTNVTLTNNTNDVTITSAYPPDATTSVKGIAELATDGETASGVVVQGNDSRLSNSRTPTAHKSSHISGGGDTFAKGDDLVAAARYLEDVADPASDAQRVWIEDATANLKYWSDEASPVKHTVATASSTTIFTNKAFDADGTGNSITNIENADIKAAAGIVTSKLADSANFILKTLDNSFGAHYQDFTKMTAPGNPGANDIRLYVDTADTHLKLKTSGGTIIDLHSPGGGGSFTGQITYSYIIYKESTNYKAYNTITNTVEFSNTTAATTFNSVITAMNSAGGGIAFIKNGVYPCAASLTMLNNVGFVGEDMYKTIVRQMNTTVQLFKYANGSGNFLTGFSLKNLTIETGNLNGNGTGETDGAWYSSGAKDCTLEYVYVKSFDGPSTPVIQVFFDTFSNVNDNTNIKVTNCEFTGDAGGEDFFGCGRMVSCDWSHNYVHDVTAQGIGVGASRRSKYNDNTFYNVGTAAIGMENDCQDNEYNNNILWNTQGIKMSQEGATATHISRNNQCKNNIISYGLGGIEAGISINDDISNNKIYRTERNGIRGSFHGTIIDGNKLVDNNFGFYTQTINAISNKVGGIVCLNNATPLPNNYYNVIQNNTFTNTNTTWTDPVASTTEESDMCGVILDTNYRYTTNINNNGNNLDVATTIDYSTNKLQNGGYYCNPEDKIFVIDEQILQMKGTDNNTFNFLETTGQTAPNQAFDFFANYTKQASATNVPFSFGYNSDIKAIEFWSKWNATEGNKAYFGIDVAANRVYVDALLDIKGLKTGYKSVTTTPVTLDLADDQFVKVDASGGARTVNLPAASGSAGQFITILKSDSSTNTVTIDANASETINGALTYVLSIQYQSIILRCDGAAWFTTPYSTERRGKSTASGDGTTTTFNVPHGLGSDPHDAIIKCSSHSTAFTYTTTTTNIVVVFITAPGSGTNNVIFHWSVVA